jgi:four helix bundle protein
MNMYHDPEIWERSRQFCSDLYQLTATDSYYQTFYYTPILRQIAVLIPTHIMLAYQAPKPDVLIRHLDFTLGAAYELRTLLMFNVLLDFEEKSPNRPLIHKINILIASINLLRERVQTGRAPRSKRTILWT